MWQAAPRLGARERPSRGLIARDGTDPETERKSRCTVHASILHARAGEVKSLSHRGASRGGRPVFGRAHADRPAIFPVACSCDQNLRAGAARPGPPSPSPWRALEWRASPVHTWRSVAGSGRRRCTRSSSRSPIRWIPASPVIGTLPSGGSSPCKGRHKEIRMFRSILLWMLGIPIPIIILLWLFLD